MPSTTGDVEQMRSSIGVRPGDLMESCGANSSMMCFCSSSLVMFVTVMGDRCSPSESSLRVMLPAVQTDCSSSARFRSLTSIRLMPAFFIAAPFCTCSAENSAAFGEMARQRIFIILKIL